MQHQHRKNTMKLSELIKELKGIEGDPEVIVSKDTEGNGYNPLSEVAWGYWDPEERELVDPTELEDDDDWAEAVVVLWP
jgi:hypothetical protein